MKHRLIILAAALLLTPMSIFSQTYQQLWKQVEEARQKDLPKTAMQHLQKIENKAQKERAFGQLLKATLLRARLQAEVAPDSLNAAVLRLEQQEQQAAGAPLKAVYATVLSEIYGENRQLADDSEARSKAYRSSALEHPEELAGVKAETYVPFVVKGKDSDAFGHDLLSVVGMELNAWEWMADYYERVGNRRALCHLALRTANTLTELDSLSARYGDLPEASIIVKKRQNLWAVQTNPLFHVSLPHSVTEVSKPQTVRLERLRHLQSLTMRVYRTRLAGDTDLNPMDSDDYKKLKGGLTEQKELACTRTYAGHQDDEYFDDSLQLAGLPAGVYMLEFTTQPATEVVRTLCFVSGVRVVKLALPQSRMRYVVVDATTGLPLSNATLRLVYRSGWNLPKKQEEMACNLQGEVVVNQDKRQPAEVFAYTPSDNYCPAVNGYGRYSYYERQYNNEHTSLFTDRSIYRPGQTVRVAAIVWKEQSVTDHVAVEGKRMTMELRDANYRVVAEQQLTTDHYGKCATEFTLPAGLLNGTFTIRANGTSTDFRVEEYKRPTFQVEFPEYKEAYQAGDTVRAKGKAMSFAGVPVQDASVKYTVHRQVAWWWLNYSWYWGRGYVGDALSKEMVYEGEATTGDDGTFEVLMPMSLPADLKDSPMYYSFVVEADVTDEAGETHHATMRLPLGTKPTALTCDLPQQVRSDKRPQVTFSRRNAAGREIAGTVSYRIDRGKWQQAAANAPHALLPASLKSGEHRLEAVCEQDSVSMSFVIFSLDDQKPANTTHDWFYVSDHQFANDGTPVTVQVGSSDPDLHIVYALFAGDQLLESGVVRKNAELLNRKFTYQEEYGNGLLMTFAWVKDGQCYTHNQTIARPVPDKQLRLTWETFRDRLTPGQQEEWRLKIQHPDGTPAEASLLAVLYDKSLDQIRQHQWSFAPSSYMPLPSTGWQWTSWGGSSLSAASPLKLQDVPAFAYSHFDDDVLPQYVYFGRQFSAIGANRVYKLAAAPMAESKAAIGAFDTMDTDEAAAVVMTANSSAMDDVAAGGASAEPQQEENVQLRENLNETAFCYPALLTDKDGDVTLKFTLPESLTTWRFMGVANTADMLYGSIGGEAVAQKEVMVQPNVPRFVRQGDEVHITARIFNLKDEQVTGVAHLMLINPERGSCLIELDSPFQVEAGKTTTVGYWVPCIWPNVSLCVCKITVSGDGFSDGEQHYLPVLPDREYVTKTVPFTQHEPGVKAIDLSTLFPAGTTRQKLTVEYTNNPAWLTVQSLPVLGQPWEHSAIDQAASYYSNLLAKVLLEQSPQVKTTFEQWKRESGAENTLQSQLQKNESLKDLVLAETPWVAAADREAEQRQRLADFFDENAIANRLATALDKLGKLQNGDGSFSWYPGMEGSPYITMAVEEMLVRLNKMAGEQTETRQMQDMAFSYLGKEMTDLVAALKKQEKKGHKPTFPSFTALRWLYLCALDGRQLSAQVKSANDYLILLLKKDIKQQTIYEKALTAVVLAKHGEAARAAEYVKSLKEYTVYTEERGRYYDSPRAGYSWYDYKIPTEVAAIEAIRTVTPADQQTVDEMRRWLLQEKRTQAWDTPINSVNAIWAFLSGNGQVLNAGNNQPAVLAIDGSPLDLPTATASLGYVKTAQSYNGEKTFTAEKTSEGTSWGAVYAQFLQQASEIAVSQSGITVKREVLTAQGPLNATLSEREQLTANSLAVGDRIKIRITIETTRDLDFVQVVDRRAACMEPVRQLSGYQNGAYVSPKDHATHYYYGGLAKGKHVIETEYYIDREGRYESGICTVGSAYAPEFRATAPSMTFNIK